MGIDLELLKRTLEAMTDEEFSNLLDEMESDPEDEGGITVGEFMEMLKERENFLNTQSNDYNTQPS